MTTHNAQAARAPGIFAQFNEKVLNQTGYYPLAGQVSGFCRFTGALAVIVGESVHAAGLALGSVVGPNKRLRGKCRTSLPDVASRVKSAAQHLGRGGVEMAGAGVVLYYRDQVVRLNQQLIETGLLKARLENEIDQAKKAIEAFKAEKDGKEKEISDSKFGLSERTKELEGLRAQHAAATAELKRLQEQVSKSKK